MLDHKEFLWFNTEVNEAVSIITVLVVKKRGYEIDIISNYQDNRYFVEICYCLQHSDSRYRFLFDNYF